jgi:hypothetical protein
MPFDIDFDAEATSTLFVTCVYLLTDALKASPSAQDALRIGVLRLRLTRWGEAVNIMNDSPTLTKMDADAEDIDDIRQALIKLAGRFERYHVSGDDAAGKRSRPLIPPFWLGDSLFMELEKITLERCGGLELSLVRGPLVFSRAPTVDRSVWAKVAACISEVAELEQILPAGPGLRRLCAVERLRFSGEVVAALGHAAVGIDPWLRRDNEPLRLFHGTEILTQI